MIHELENLNFETWNPTQKPKHEIYNLKYNTWSAKRKFREFKNKFSQTKDPKQKLSIDHAQVPYQQPKQKNLNAQSQSKNPKQMILTESPQTKHLKRNLSGENSWA